MEPLKEVMDRTPQVRLAQLARAYPLKLRNKTWGFLGPRHQIYEVLACQFGLTIEEVKGYFERKT